MKAKDRNNQPIRFRFCDSMGLEGNSGLKAVDVAKIIDGHVQDGADVSNGTRGHYCCQGFHECFYAFVSGQCSMRGFVDTTQTVYTGQPSC